MRMSLALTSAVVLLVGASPSAAGGGIWLTSPVNGATVAPNESVSFEFGTEWRTGMFPGKLGLQVARDPALTDLVVDDVLDCPASFDAPTCPTSAARGPFAEGTYYWRVRFQGFRESGPPEWSPSETWSFTVTSTQPPAANQPPVARFGGAPNPSRVGEVVNFDGAASTDPDGSIVSYSWTFGNGNGAAGSPLAGAAYSEVGTYTVKLVVVDDGGASGEATMQIVVEAESPSAPPPPPVGPPVTQPPPTTTATTTEPRAADTTAPLVRALTSRGRRGAAVRLRYLASDASGWSSVEATIRATGRVIGRVQGVARGTGNPVRTLAWLAPTRATLLSFCVRAHDRDGNTSGASCARLHLR